MIDFKMDTSGILKKIEMDPKSKVEIRVFSDYPRQIDMNPIFWARS